MPKTFIYICGESAIGKRTLIEKTMANKDGLQSRFGIAKAETAECFGPIGDVKNPSSVTFKPYDSVLTTNADLALIKWQWKEHYRLPEFYQEFPASIHNAIVLWRPWVEHWPDFETKHPQRASAEKIEYLKRVWREKILPQFEPDGIIPNLGIQVELVDASKPHYPKMDEWPNP